MASQRRPGRIEDIRRIIAGARRLFGTSGFWTATELKQHGVYITGGDIVYMHSSGLLRAKPGKYAGARRWCLTTKGCNLIRN